MRAGWKTSYINGSLRARRKAAMPSIARRAGIRQLPGICWYSAKSVYRQTLYESRVLIPNVSNVSNPCDPSIPKDMNPNDSSNHKVSGELRNKVASRGKLVLGRSDLSEDFLLDTKRLAQVRHNASNAQR